MLQRVWLRFSPLAHLTMGTPACAWHISGSPGQEFELQLPGIWDLASLEQNITTVP